MKKIKLSRLVMPAFLGSVFLTAFGVMAREGADLKGGACHADVEKFCQNGRPGHGGIRLCLKEHEQELSPECRVKREAKREERQRRKEAIKRRRNQ